MIFDCKNSIFSLTYNIGQIDEMLTTITGYLTDWYRSEEPIPFAAKNDLFQSLKAARESVINAEQSSHHIEDVAQTLSQISKGQNAQMTRISVRTFLKGMVRIGMLRTYSDRVKTQALEKPPEVEAPLNLPSVRAHTELLKSVFINLFKNAIHAMDGVVPKEIKIRAMVDPEDENMVRIEFSDNGCGIAPEDLSHIFDYGFTTKGDQGEGKGLYNVKAIIEAQHRGKIEVQSEVGKGTLFILKLPVWKDE